ncbi:glycosyltransferase family 10 domain-containing protein [Chitinophaga solisilvae]|uniref:glycosyltransferase family 10 domain-containing protein n=1 Tax=Chitinophaga solisilvae TaxID=1233460 RepID=UPI001370DD2E|nr:glycosyltransferase family 10 [Chitinophaga solisilvae]
MRTYTILFYNTMWGHLGDLDELQIPPDIRIEKDISLAPVADVIVFHMPTLERAPLLTKQPGQLWVFWTLECDLNYPYLYTPEIQALFDVHMTYRLNADITVPYILPAYREDLRRMSGPKDGFVNAFISSGINGSKRNEYLQELMQLLDVHSYGKVFNNRKITGDNGRQTKLDIIARYKFTLAFENAVATDYITEKFYDPLIAGSVPVYLGAPNIRELAPGNHCFINVADFNTASALAAYLLELDRNEDEYGRFFDWKEQAFAPDFSALLDMQEIPTFIRLFDLIRKMKEANEPPKI